MFEPQTLTSNLRILECVLAATRLSFTCCWCLFNWRRRASGPAAGCCPGPAWACSWWGAGRARGSTAWRVPCRPPLAEIYKYINFKKIMWKFNSYLFRSGWDVLTLLDFQFTPSQWDQPCLLDQQTKDCVTGWGRLRHYHPTQVLSPPLRLIQLLTVYIQEYLSYFFAGETFPDLRSFTCSTRGFCMYHHTNGLILE